jgi:hypothetical protein
VIRRNQCAQPKRHALKLKQKLYERAAIYRALNATRVQDTRNLEVSVWGPITVRAALSVQNAENKPECFVQRRYSSTGNRNQSTDSFVTCLPWNRHVFDTSKCPSVSNLNEHKMWSEKVSGNFDHVETWCASGNCDLCVKTSIIWLKTIPSAARGTCVLEQICKRNYTASGHMSIRFICCFTNLEDMMLNSYSNDFWNWSCHEGNKICVCDCWTFNFPGKS